MKVKPPFDSPGRAAGEAARSLFLFEREIIVIMVRNLVITREERLSRPLSLYRFSSRSSNHAGYLDHLFCFFRCCSTHSLRCESAGRMGVA